MEQNARLELTDHSLAHAAEDYGKSWAQRISLPVRLARTSCPPEDMLEAYARNRLSEPEAALLEEHLLVCHACQDALAAADTFLKALRAALAEPPPEAEAPAVTRAPRVRAQHAVWAALAAGLSLIGLLSPWGTQSGTALAAVTLTSMRGAPGASIARVPAGVEFELHIDTSHLSMGDRSRVEIVDSGGGPVWRTSVAAQEQLQVMVPQKLRTGLYWVRLYRGERDLLQEFGLRAE